MPGFTLSKVVQAPVAEVFRAFTDVDTMPARITGIVRTEKLTPGPVGRGTKFKETRVMFKREATETFEFTAFEPNRMCELTATSCGAEYRCKFTFTPEGTGTRVDLALDTHAVRWWAKLMMPLGYLMMGTMKKCVQQDMDDVAAAIEGPKRAA